MPMPAIAPLLSPYSVVEGNAVDVALLAPCDSVAEVDDTDFGSVGLVGLATAVKVVEEGIELGAMVGGPALDVETGEFDNCIVLL